MYRSIRLVLALGGVVLVGFIACVVFTIKEISLEYSFHQSFGEDWKAQYEKSWGADSLARAHERVGAASVGIVALPTLVIWLLKVLRNGPHKSNKRVHRRRRGSTVDRSVRARRNALLGNYFGLGGIALGLLLVIFRWGIFARHYSEIILGVFVFIAGYASVIYGCWWWVQSKGWPEAVVFIGLAPLALVCTPFIRLLFLASPMALPAAMVMAPMILLVVVAVLPNKSGVKERRARWSYKDIEEKQDGD